MPKKYLLGFALLLSAILSTAQTGYVCGSQFMLYTDYTWREYAVNNGFTYNKVAMTCWNDSARAVYFLFDVGQPNGQGIFECFEAEIEVIGGAEPVEAVVIRYDSCSFGYLETIFGDEKICSSNGKMVWAMNEGIPANQGNYQPYTSYVLRVAVGNGYGESIKIRARKGNPNNHTYQNAVALSKSAITYNNACNFGGDASQCSSNENTAFYKFTTSDTASQNYVVFSGLNCPNKNLTNIGHQIEAFKYKNGQLQQIGSCQTGTQTQVVLDFTQHDGGTEIYVSIDGVIASNCKYSVRRGSSSGD